MDSAADGLEGVVVARTVLSEVDGEAGRLVIRGRTLDELAQGVPPLRAGDLAAVGNALRRPSRRSQAPPGLPARLCSPRSRPRRRAYRPHAHGGGVLVSARLSDGEEMAVAWRWRRRRRCSRQPPARRRQGERLPAPDPNPRPTPPTCCVDDPRRPGGRGGGCAGRLPGHGKNPIMGQRLDLPPGGRLDHAGLASAVIAGLCASRDQGPAAPRTVIECSTPSASPGKRLRLDCSAVRSGRTHDGLRPPNLPGARPKGRCAQGGRQPPGREIQRSSGPTGLRRSGGGRAAISSAARKPDRLLPTSSSSTPRCCSNRWRFRPRSSPVSSPPEEWPAGSPMPANSWPGAA